MKRNAKRKRQSFNPAAILTIKKGMNYHLKTVLKVVIPFSEKAEISAPWLDAIFFAIARPKP